MSVKLTAASDKKMLGKYNTGTVLNGACTVNNMVDVEHQSSIEDNVDMADKVLISKSINEEIDETNRPGYEENRGSKLDQNNLSVEFCKVTMRFL